MIGTRMRGAALTFDVLYTSPATRAVETARLLVQGAQESEERIVVVEELYLADEYELLDFLKERPASLESVGLVLHNPAVTSLANRIGDLQIENISAGGTYSVEFDVKRWAEIADRRGRTIRSDRPPKRS